MSVVAGRGRGGVNRIVLAQGTGDQIEELEETLVALEADKAPGTELELVLDFRFVGFMEFINDMIARIDADTTALGLMATGIENVARLANVRPWATNDRIVFLQEPNRLIIRWTRNAVLMPALVKWLLHPTIIGIALGFVAARAISWFQLARVVINSRTVRLMIIGVGVGTAFIIVPRAVEFLDRGGG
jgi:hypothetical protein